MRPPLAGLLLVGLAACGRVNFDARDRAAPADGPAFDADVDGAMPSVCGARITPGRKHLCVYAVGGELSCWGDNTQGQLGAAPTDQGQYAPTTVPGLGPVTSAAAGRFSTCAALVDGRVACFGDNGDGQLGDNTRIDSAVPVDAIGLTGATEVAAAALHSCAIAGGEIWCWGDGAGGRLGTGDELDQLIPIAQGTPQIVDPMQLTAGGSHSCAIDTNRAAWCWGLNDNGQLGIDSTAVALSPVQPLIGPVLDMRVRDYSSCAVTMDRQAWCFGNGENGQLGNGGTADEPLAVEVTGVDDAVEVGVAIRFACARTADGGVACWGNALDGALGDGSTSGIRATAAPVIGLPPVTQLVVTAFSSCAMAFDGEVWCWGLNDKGQLGVPPPAAVSATPVLAFDACP